MGRRVLNGCSVYYHPNRNKLLKQSKVKLYILLRRNLKTKVIEGFVDESICSMSWSKWCVNVWAYPPTHYLPTKRQIGNWEYFIARVNAKSCPVEVDMVYDNGHQRYGKGNRQFVKKKKFKVPKAHPYPEIYKRS